MLDHLGLRVRDLALSKAFYTAALAPLGYGPITEIPAEANVGYVGVGFGREGKPAFWVGAGTPNGPVHVAFVAKDRAAVDAFYKAALAAGAKDNGAPGVRPHYHPGYYGAFVLDLDGNNIEAVCHRPA